MSDEKMMDDMALSESALSDDSLEDIAGGRGGDVGDIRVVYGLKTGYLAMRTARCYDYKNEMRGHELYNGDKVKIIEKSTKGTDGRYYTKVSQVQKGRQQGLGQLFFPEKALILTADFADG